MSEKRTTDIRCEDFGQFRISGNYSNAENLIETLVSNGYSVTVKEEKETNAAGINSHKIIIMYRFGDL